MKDTKQRNYILDVLNHHNKSLYVEEICDLVNKKSPSHIALSTIYRNVSILLNNDIIIKTFDNNGKAMYIKNHKHSHEFECSKCHKIITLDVCPYTIIEENLKNNGLTLEETKIKVRCNTCK
jgi:transcriptional regulator, Fur family